MKDPAEICVQAIRFGNKILICGNGGSASMASHFAAELVVRYAVDRPALPCISLAADQSVITAAANDLGYECIFERQIEALGKKGDILIPLSTSGRSRNINRAIARAHDMHMIVLEPERKGLTTAEKQQDHLTWLHWLAGAIEDAFTVDKVV